MTDFLTIGIILGISAGFAPGPLLTLVISETLHHDIKAGVKVALAPIITDVPIIIITCVILGKLSGFHTVLGAISLAGGFFIFFIGIASIRSRGGTFTIQPDPPQSLTKGIVANALNPHPYLFWFSVGAPIMTRAMHVSMIALVAFIAGFYMMLVGSKIVLAIVVGRSKSFLEGKVYIYTLRVLGVILCGLAAILFRDGLRLLGFL